MDMVERVAKAQRDAATRWLAEYVAANPERSYYSTIAIVPDSVRAIAAIEAMREPLIEKLRAAIQYSGCPSPDIEDEIVEAIDAILKSTRETA